ncbi:MAG: hypothetical protein ACUVV5_12520, partial [Candidatus Aminicenantales bacterium]
PPLGCTRPHDHLFQHQALLIDANSLSAIFGKLCKLTGVSRFHTIESLPRQAWKGGDKSTIVVGAGNDLAT